MKNTINYYYNVRINNIVKNNEDYYFFINNNEYHLVRLTRPIEEVQALFKLNQEMLKKNILVHEIVTNKDHSIITIINNVPHVLLKLCDYKSGDVSLYNINYYQNMTYNIAYDNELLRDDWIKLWGEKIDYYEYQINQFGKEYPILCNSLSYYIGLGENAISYLINNIKASNKVLTVSHKRIKNDNGSFEFYNPLNFVIDERVRDVCEYIKNKFFSGQLNYNEIIEYFNNNIFNYNDYVYFFSRLIFPTYYFDIYDEIINRKLNEQVIFPIINMANDYEMFLITIYKYIVYKKNIQLEPIEWIIKNQS